LNYVDPNVSIDYNYYPSINTDNYPNFDINVSPSFQVVTSLENVSQSIYRRQDYKYSGAVSNVEGLGFMGFRSLLKTNWFDNNNQIITSISKYDISKRGALSETCTFLGQTLGNFIGYNPTNFISKSTNSYYDELLSNKVYKLNNILAVHINGLDGTSNEISRSYYPTNDVWTINSLTKKGINVEQNAKTIFEYYDNSSSTVSPYYIGLPKNKTVSVTYNNETMTEEEQYVYYSSLLLSQVKKKGHLTNYLTEDYLYDGFGNLIQKKTTAVGVSSPRVFDYTYNPSAPYYGRFLTKIKDLDGLETNYDYYASTGYLKSETLPSTSASYQLKTSFDYDVWGKTKLVTDYIGKTNSIKYSTASNSGYSYIENIGQDGSYSITEYDELGRNKKNAVKNIDNRLSTVTTSYDIYNRVLSVSEPFFGFDDSPNGYNTTTYDQYGRVIQTNEFSGKTTTFSYSGLNTSVFDGIKTISTTKNSLGYIMNLTDNGGTIDYEYFPNGNLKQSSFDGTTIDVLQDGWGRKIELKDPNAGVYRYEYNDFGELLNEKKIIASTITAPGTGLVKSTTTYNLNPGTGKLNYKTVVGQNGDNTNSKTSYTYNGPGFLLSNSKFEDFTGNFNINHTYGYDDFKRLNYSEESGPLSVYQRKTEFDLFGRAEKELYTAILNSSLKRSDRWIKNTYKNGYPWQIIDDASNTGSTSQVLWQNNEVNERGQLTNSVYGNGISITNSYDQYGFLNMSKHDKNPTTNLITLTTAFQSTTGNLNSRSNSLFNWSENFQYDNLDRLTFFTNAKGVSEQQNYNLNGSIDTNDSGKYYYTNSSKKYQNTSVTVSSEALAYYKLREGVFFDTMENQKGWQLSNPSIFSFDSSFSYTGIAPNNTGGKVSLKIKNKTFNPSSILSEVWIPINNTSITEYTYSGWVYSSSPQSEMGLILKDAAGNLTYDNLTDNTVGQWKFVTKTVNVPANVKKLCFRLGNNGQGTVWFDNVKIKLTNNASVITDDDRRLNISYNSYKSPIEIIEPGNDFISFDYNMNDSRSIMYYGGLQADKLQRPLRKYYSSDGSMEVKENLTTNEFEFTTYVGGDGYFAPVIFRSTINATGTQNNQFLYLHRDYQGTILAISNQLGNFVEKRLFDAWGNIIKIQDEQGNILSKLVILDRGYTGHEHLQDVALIHMNGRLYDPMIHRFLQPDNFIQDPYNTQNYNRYGYVLNNPLKYSDPSGETGEDNTGPSAGEQSFIGNLISTIVYSWDELGIKDWSNRNFNLNRWSDQIGSVGQFFGRNIESVGNWFGRNINSILGIKDSTPNYLPSTPSFSNHQLSNGWQNDGFKNNLFTGVVASQWSNFADIASDSGKRINHYFPENDKLFRNMTSNQQYAWARYDLQGETRRMLSKQGQALSEIIKPRSAQYQTAKYYADNNIAPSGNLRGGMRMAKIFRSVGRLGVVGSAGASLYNVYNANNKALAITREVGGWAGAYEFAAIGASWGSAIGPWGTLIGGIAGGAFGYWAGSNAGEILYNNVKP
jgi:RHS repeat-associated protein